MKATRRDAGFDPNFRPRCAVILYENSICGRYVIICQVENSKAVRVVKFTSCQKVKPPHDPNPAECQTKRGRLVWWSSPSLQINGIEVIKRKSRTHARRARTSAQRTKAASHQTGHYANSCPDRRLLRDGPNDIMSALHRPISLTSCPSRHLLALIP